MAFRVYKPRNFVKIKAEQVTGDTILDLADRLMGRVVEIASLNEGEAPHSVLELPTFAGTMKFALGDWIIRNDDNTLTKMHDVEFQKTYEVARNTNGS